jgi:hypothetical protein
MKSVYSAVRTGSLNKADLRTTSDLCNLKHKLTGFYSGDEKCLQRGTDWAFKKSGLRFVFKGLNNNRATMDSRDRCNMQSSHI